MATSDTASARHRTRVLVAGGGVAGIETLLALRALAADLLDITILAPELKFVNRAMSVDQPFRAPRVRGIRLKDTTAELGAHWHQGTLDRVEHRQHHVVTRDGDQIPYDKLVIALGAHPQREWDARGVLSYGGRDHANYGLLLHQLREGQVTKLAFVRPEGATWPLPLYDLALSTAADCAAHGRTDVQLSLITPERQPLEIFGTTVSSAVRRLLDEAAVTLHTASTALPSRPGWLDIAPGDRGMRVDRVVTVPRLVGPLLRGIPCGPDGFIHTDTHGRLPGIDDVYAAGDATDFPVKHGGLAAQQADTVAEAIAAAVGADIDPQPFAPILRAVLLTGGAPRYLYADLSDNTGQDSVITEEALWSPPNKLSGRYLAPYLSSQVGDRADVMPQDQHTVAIDDALDLRAGEAGHSGEKLDARRSATTRHPAT